MGKFSDRVLVNPTGITRLASGEQAGPVPNARHQAGRIIMHAARVLWSGRDPSHVPKLRFSRIETGLCKMLSLDF
jgi:hypothetical protein